MNPQSTVEQGGEIEVRIDPKAITIAFNRPDKRNAMSMDMCRFIQDVLSRHVDTPLPVVFRSAIPGIFVAGTDLADILDRSLDASLARTTASLCQRIENHPWPTIAVVEGYALGGGCELALACDFRISEASAVWGFPEVTLGIIPAGGGLTRLIPLVGRGNATDLILTGRRIGAEAALAMGLVQRVASSVSLDDALNELLDELGKGAPLAQRLAKEAMKPGDSHRLVDAAAQALCIASSDARHRLSARLGGTTT